MLSTVPATRHTMNARRYYNPGFSMKLLLLLSHVSRAPLCATPQTAAHQAPRPWDSPGKNTGVGCHFLLQCMKVKSESEVTQFCPTLSDPMDCSLSGSSVHGIFQARVLEWGATAFSFYEANTPQILHEANVTPRSSMKPMSPRSSMKLTSSDPP